MVIPLITLGVNFEPKSRSFSNKNESSTAVFCCLKSEFILFKFLWLQFGLRLLKMVLWPRDQRLPAKLCWVWKNDRVTLHNNRMNSCLNSAVKITTATDICNLQYWLSKLFCCRVAHDHVIDCQQRLVLGIQTIQRACHLLRCTVPVWPAS